MDEIRIERLEVFAHHGVYPEERKKGQPFFVSAVLYTDTRKAGWKDDLSLSTDYGEVCRFLTEWLRGHTYRLIETAAETAVRQLLLRFPLVREAALEISKPQAPVGLPFQDISVKIRRGWHKAYLSLGSNLGDREANLQGAVEALRACEDIRIGKLSDLIMTKPYGGVKQEDFLNGALELDTLLTPWELLDELHRIEQAAGRERTVHWGPRTLDLDILFYGKEIVEEENLVIPHADLSNRFFVLKPMAQIAPYFRHPVLRKTMAELLEDWMKKQQQDYLREQG